MCYSICLIMIDLYHFSDMYILWPMCLAMIVVFYLLEIDLIYCLRIDIIFCSYLFLLLNFCAFIFEIISILLVSAIKIIIRKLMKDFIYVKIRNNFM